MWFRQLPFQTLVVFVLGTVLGFSWNTGLIPVEFSAANTGTLSEVEADQTDSKPASSIPPYRVDQAEEVLTDSTVVAQQAEPTVPVPVNKQQDRLSRTSRPESSHVIRLQSDETESVKPAELKRLLFRRQPAQRTDRAAERTEAKAIQLVSHEEPANRETAIPVKDKGTSLQADDLKAIDEQIANNEFLSANRALSKLYWSNKERRDDVLPRLRTTSAAIFFEPRPHLIEPYVVQPNDQLRVIANKYQLSWEYLGKLNRTDPRRLQVGQKLKVLKGPFAAVVDLSEFALTIHLQGYFVKRYSVGIGKDESSPIGKFAVLNKVENPQYTGPDGKVISADDPANPLGERWIDLGDSYGIHGTIDPGSIGKAASRGCIRMHSEDVIEVYNFLVKGSEVVIRK